MSRLASGTRGNEGVGFRFADCEAPDRAACAVWGRMAWAADELQPSKKRRVFTGELAPPLSAFWATVDRSSRLPDAAARRSNPSSYKCKNNAVVSVDDCTRPSDSELRSPNPS